MSLTAPQKTAAKMVGVVIVMGSLAWASVPFYDWFCRVTGFGGATSVAEQGSDVVLDQEILVRFDASLERGMPWEFKPVQHDMRIRIGETGLAFYEAYNPTDRPIAGTASYNVAPYAAGGFFTKIDCFCFEQQVLQPGERVTMPVTFYVDPELTKDREGKFVKAITLSYTFHETDLPEEVARLATDADAGN
ncbi:cytochrome c oxidase assembly protein [Aliiroseovarius crassostreae]|uniref:Cytochrome c oxidase assembly protein CtaG n=1 Tax=Aliiroseovarius crassostreae TaxID=154981 RepID=A0A9Q9HCY5_9RHOB|nr:cytochrome c oxidase assembly protein [Aliiroseovarius crassostreae]UWP88175.1 cytochrome c oxidase assembly protein [Aliiroseovarius crassostreae]UWP91327.1 cytochrome c oxidase assembly protein [Aliiroseovarius crassostreae]UWP94510.1 cytochrome c oxidase assembly protein [Aliiroseovarius crassostreae]UWP97637.1 cytochrome c oxidase assembly protein [Aliiroseovarius crassostreae]UWQ00792.1 cytochrome c oxidase assembly protein [Aliiroseovarius crassostreae]